MVELVVPSGAKVEINVASFETAKKLKNAIEREVAIAGGINYTTVLLVDSSETVNAALLPCLARCTYNNERITDQTFDKKEARRDYYVIAEACIRENLGPLAEGLFSKLKEHGLLKQAKATADGQKSESTTT